ncbi:hypothetical protein ACTFIZ_011816 [Dictyostelium cf. discoideum]
MKRYRNQILFFLILFSLLCLVNGQFQLTDLSSNTDKIKYLDSDGSTCNFKIPILASGAGTLNFLSEDTIPAQWFPYSYSSGANTLFLLEFNSIKKGEKEYTIFVEGVPSMKITLSCLLFSSLLSFNLIKPVFWSSTLKYSSIISVDGLPSGSSTFEFDKSSFNLVILGAIGSTTFIRVEFNEYYYFENKLNSIWPIQLTFKESNYTIKIPFISSKIDFDQPVDIKTYPNPIDIDFMGDIFGGEITFRSVSSNQRPIYSLSTSFNNSQIYVSPRPISGNANNITYIVYCRRFETNEKQIYNLNSFSPFGNISISTTSKFYNTLSIFNNNSPNLISNNQVDGKSFDLSFENLKSYDFQTYQYQFKSGSSIMKLAFPFGFKSGDNLKFNYLASFLTSYQSSNPTSVLKIDDIPFQVSPNQLDITIDNTLRIEDLLFFEAGNFKFVIRIMAGSSYSVKYFIIPLKNGLNIKIDNSNCISQNLLLGFWEYIFDVFLYGSDFEGNIIIYNFNDHQKSYSLGYPYDARDSRKILLLPKIDLSNCNYLQDIKNISFLNNNIDLTNQNVDNMIYFSFGNDKNKFYITKSIGFSLTDPKSLRDQGFNGDISKYYNTKLTFAKFDSLNNRFSAPFKMPANTVPGQLDYTLIFDKDNIILSTLLPMEYQLNVTSSNVDIQGPMITNIIYNYNSLSFGWTITIEDSINGFDNGYILIRGVIDSSIYNISFSNKDSKNGNNKFKNNYDILIELDKTYKCISQNYSINYVYLVDTFGNDAIFYKHATDIQLNKIVYNFDSTGNPLINFMNQQNLLTILSPDYCNSPQVDSTIILLNFNTITTQIDSGSINRSVTFDFQVQDTIWGLKKDQYPIVYLISQDFKSVQCVSKIVSLDDFKGVYQCTFDQLPLGFGFPNGLSISVYGFINNGGQFYGFSSSMLKSLGFKNFIGVPNYNPNLIFITGSSEVTELDSEFFIYGTAFLNVVAVRITLSNSTQFECTFQCFLNSIIKVLYFPIGIKDPFTIKLIDVLNDYSNDYIVTPIQYNFKYEPIITETPIITYPPQKCKGSPECGGTSNGYCSNSGCICYSPWFGVDCTSQIITVAPPLIDIDKPITSIDVPKDSNGNNITSIISIVALREINSLTNEQIKIHYFEKWIYKNISSTISQYTSNITNGDGDSVDGKTITTTITATLEWFTESKNISFANQKLIMNPSSMKYTIELSSYAFSNSLSNLQVVMSAQIQSNQRNICSDKDFGNTTMENSNYIKLQVASNSFYGRYIKRGIVDGKIITVENEILDSKFNAIQSENSAQTFIGVLIGNYVNYAIIDPDFSILIESNSANSNSPNSMCTTLNSTKLSTGQLIGIIIGSFIAFLALLIIIIFLMYKSSNFLSIKIFIYKITKKSKL